MPNNITRTVGRPRAVIKLPRRKNFTVLDVIVINEYSDLTIRNSLNRLIQLGELVIAGTKKAGSRGRPRYILTRSSDRRQAFLNGK